MVALLSPAAVDNGGWALALERPTVTGVILNEPASEGITVFCWDYRSGIIPCACGKLVARDDVACRRWMPVWNGGMETPARAHVSGRWEDVVVYGVALVDCSL